MAEPAGCSAREGSGASLGHERSSRSPVPQPCPAAPRSWECSGTTSGQRSWAGAWTHGRAAVPHAAAQDWVLGQADRRDLLVTRLCRLPEEPPRAAALCPSPPSLYFPRSRIKPSQPAAEHRAAPRCLLPRCAGVGRRRPSKRVQGPGKGHGGLAQPLRSRAEDRLDWGQQRHFN